MLKNIIKIGFRSFVKNKAHTFINVIGLSIGITSALIIFMIIRFDLSFDNYHDHKELTYRLVVQEKVNDEVQRDSGVPYPMHLSFPQDFAEVEYFTYVDNNIGDPVVSFKRNGTRLKLKEDDMTVAFVMPDYFQIFSYEFILGDAKKALIEPNKVVISRSLAEKYFGDPLSAMGKALVLDSYIDVTITGVVEDTPKNTDVPFNMLLSFDTYKDRMWDTWTATSSSVHCYLKLYEGVDLVSFSDKISSYIQDHKQEGERVSKSILLPQPLSGLHFNKDYPIFTGRVISHEEIITLAIIGVLLLVAASINFVNLNTAQAVKRSREIGIRKVLGSGRFNLAAQFIAETTLITLLATLISLGLAELLLLNIEKVIGYSLPSTSYDLSLFVALMTMVMVVSLLSGLYPAIVISGYKPVAALKNSLATGYRNGLSLRRSLIVLQLLISQVLIIAVIVVTQQLQHFISTPIGVNTDGIIEFSIPEPEEKKLETLGSRLSSVTGLESITFSNTGSASSNTWGGKAEYNGGQGLVTFSIQVKLIDQAYLDTYDIKLLAGRNLPVDTVRRYLINKKAMHELGIKNTQEALGIELKVWGKRGMVVGVVDDFNTTSLHRELEPVAMWVQPNSYYLGAVKMMPGDWSNKIGIIKKEWERLFPDYIFSYQFLDERIEQFYESEQRTSRTAIAFAGVAIFIGAIGLLGLMSYLVNTRTKEIGVRKVLGASIRQVIQLLSADFVKLVGIAFLIAAPVSWFFMDQWLQSFASRISIDLWVFLLALGCSMMITMVTVGVRSFQASIVNPIDVLKDE